MASPGSRSVPDAHSVNWEPGSRARRSALFQLNSAHYRRHALEWDKTMRAAGEYDGDDPCLLLNRLLERGDFDVRKEQLEKEGHHIEYHGVVPMNQVRTLVNCCILETVTTLHFAIVRSDEGPEERRVVDEPVTGFHYFVVAWNHVASPPPALTANS